MKIKFYKMVIDFVLKRIFLFLFVAGGVFFIIGIFGATILYLCWPIAIPSVFPGLVSKGIISSVLPFKQALAFFYIIMAILFPITNRNISKDSLDGK